MNNRGAPKGTADIYPPEITHWQVLEGRIHSIARRFGYGEIRTPMFEFTDLFVRGVGEATDIVEKEMYTFEDKGKRSITLRPELTAPVVRAVLQHNLLVKGPLRLYYIGPFFRYERPQKGRFRQAHQFGVECLGYGRPEADVEVIHLAYELLKSYNIPVTLHINNIGDSSDRPAYRDALQKFFLAHKNALSEVSLSRLNTNPLRILDSKEPEDQSLIQNAPSFLLFVSDKNRLHFERVCKLLEETKIEYFLNEKLVRGFDYYTGTVFEFQSSSLGSQNSICGGGRYDDLVRSLGGPMTPAVGFGLGIERFLIAHSANLPNGVTDREGLAFITLGEHARNYAFPIVAILRANAIPVTADYSDARLPAQFKRADSVGARFAIIIGDDEVSKNIVRLHDLVEARDDEDLSVPPVPQLAADSIMAWYREFTDLRSAKGFS